MCINKNSKYSIANPLHMGKASFPPMNNDALAQGYPAACQSLLQIVHNTGERVNRAVEGRKK